MVANPPYSIKQWNRKAWKTDRFGRNFLGTPPQGRADYAFFQHILASLQPATGRCAILFPHGVLFRDEERAMRAKLVDLDLLEAVIGLGPNLFYNSPLEACIVVCRTRMPPERWGKVLFVNAVAEVTRERAQSFLEDDHIEKIVRAYADFAETPGFSHAATLDEIRSHATNLSIPLYVRPATKVREEAAEYTVNPLREVIAEWEASSAALRAAMDELLATLAEAGGQE